MDETHVRDNIWLPSPPAPQKKTTRNFNSLRQGCGTREQAENDQRNGFPVQGRSKTRGCEPSPSTTPNERTLSLTASFSPSFPLFPLVSPPFLPSSQGEKTSARTLDPLEDPIEFRGPRFIRLSRYTTASTCMKPGETKPMMEDHGSAASRWVEERKGTINHVLLDFEPEPTNLPGKVVVFR